MSTRPGTSTASTDGPAPRRLSAGTLITHIRSLLPSLAPAEQRVGLVASEDPAGVAAMTISELAQRCQTSETTVVRFCRAVGLAGYPDLRIALAAAAGNAESDGSWTGVGSEITEDEPLADVVAKIGAADAQAVRETVRQLDLESLDRVVSVLVQARRVDLYGVGASAFVALDLQQKLHRIGRGVHAWPDPHSALTSAALLGPGDVAIGISHTGQTHDTIDCLAKAKSVGATTVAITNFSRSPITKLADHLLTTAARETTFRSGAMASRIAALTLVDCLFVAVAQRNYAETVSALERTYDAVRNRR